MTSSFTWLESVNSTMDEIKTLIVNQEVWRVIAHTTAVILRPKHLHFVQPMCYSFPRMLLQFLTHVSSQKGTRS